MRHSFLPAFLLLGLAVGLTAEPVRIDPASGLLRVGETARVTLADSAADDTPSLVAVLKRDGATEIGRLPLVRSAPAAPVEVAFTLREPGAVLAVLSPAEGGARRARAGFLFSPELIRTAVPRSEDFDAFWDGKLAALASTPLDARIDSGRPGHIPPTGVHYGRFDLAVSATERVRGQFAHPDRVGEKFPALVIFQWAGVYPLDPGTVQGPAARGWLALNVFAHDQPFDEPREFYGDLAKGALKDYGALGADDRERSYFLRMFLGARRALDFVRQHPAWDGRVLVVQGTSQGGTQALVAAALDPAVTAVLANVPALCDQNGPEAGRAMPYPYWLAKTAGHDRAAVAATARYFDVAHFAPRVRAPVLVSAGLIDETCPPAGIAAMANALGGPREVLFMPQADHKGTGNTHAPYLERAKIWLETLRLTGTPPLAP